MHKNEVIDLAIEAWVNTSDREPFKGWFEDRADWLHAFAELIIDNDRERLAQFCEEEDAEGEPPDWRNCAFYLANCIRSFDWDEYGKADSSL